MGAIISEQMGGFARIQHLSRTNAPDRALFQLSHGAPGVDDRRAFSGILLAIRGQLRRRNATQEQQPYRSIQKRLYRWIGRGEPPHAAPTVQDKPERWLQTAGLACRGGRDPGRSLAPSAHEPATQCGPCREGRRGGARCACELEARKIVAVLDRRGVEVPAHSMAHAILKRHDRLPASHTSASRRKLLVCYVR